MMRYREQWHKFDHKAAPANASTNVFLHRQILAHSFLDRICIHKNKKTKKTQHLQRENLDFQRTGLDRGGKSINSVEKRHKSGHIYGIPLTRTSCKLGNASGICHPPSLETLRTSTMAARRCIHSPESFRTVNVESCGLAQGKLECKLLQLMVWHL